MIPTMSMEKLWYESWDIKAQSSIEWQLGKPQLWAKPPPCMSLPFALKLSGPHCILGLTYLWYKKRKKRVLSLSSLSYSFFNLASWRNSLEFSHEPSKELWSLEETSLMELDPCVILRFTLVKKMMVIITLLSLSRILCTWSILSWSARVSWRFLWLGFLP